MQLALVMHIEGKNFILVLVLAVLRVWSPAFLVLDWKTVSFASVLSLGLVTCYVALLRARALIDAVGLQGVAFQIAIRNCDSKQQLWVTPAFSFYYRLSEMKNKTLKHDKITTELH